MSCTVTPALSFYCVHENAWHGGQVPYLHTCRDLQVIVSIFRVSFVVYLRPCLGSQDLSLFAVCFLLSPSADPCCPYPVLQILGDQVWLVPVPRPSCWAQTTSKNNHQTIARSVAGKVFASNQSVVTSVYGPPFITALGRGHGVAVSACSSWLGVSHKWTSQFCRTC